MSETIQVPTDQFRHLVAIRYHNAASEILRGMRRQKGENDFHFIVSLRSFIEYTRRGIWFLVWALEDELPRDDVALTFAKTGPGLVKMDSMIRDALGLGATSPLTARVQGVGEPYIELLHALTHGNPISVRVLGIGVTKIFDLENLMWRAETDLGMFSILLYRTILGQDTCSIWKNLAPIHNRPADIQANATIAWLELKKVLPGTTLGALLLASDESTKS